MIPGDISTKGKMMHTSLQHVPVIGCPFSEWDVVHVFCCMLSHFESHLIATCLDEIATHDEHLGDRDGDADYGQAGIINQNLWLQLDLLRQNKPQKTKTNSSSRVEKPNRQN